jgi:hypothetical protein
MLAGRTPRFRAWRSSDAVRQTRGRPFLVGVRETLYEAWIVKRQFMAWAISLSVKLSLNQMGVGTALGRAH